MEVYNKMDDNQQFSIFLFGEPLKCLIWYSLWGFKARKSDKLSSSIAVQRGVSFAKYCSPSTWRKKHHSISSTIETYKLTLKGVCVFFPLCLMLCANVKEHK